MKRFAYVIGISAAIGYLSLSQEILWFRVASFATAGSPEVFAYVLGFFLFGIAFGALISKGVSQSDSINNGSFISLMLICASTLYFFSVPVIAQLGLYLGSLSIVFLFITVGIVALFVGGIFPLLCHIAISSGSAVGERMSWIYLANITGAVAGPLLTGFVLLDHLSLEENVLAICVATLLLAAATGTIAPIQSKTRLILLSTAVSAAFAMIVSHEYIYADLIEKLQYKNKFESKRSFKFIVQNRSGIVTVEESTDGDIIYGGGIYDGRFNIDPVVNSNGIRRAYMIASLHPKPADVLEIGLSSGSWAQVLADYGQIESVTIVEINPGYTQLVAQYPEVATILDDKKVKIFVDDGRRWLNRNPERRFDLIVMNTTLHWRSNTTNLLSVQFLNLVKSHLNPGGVFYYNSTGSPDVYYTAAQVFRHTTRYSNFVATSDSQFSLSTTQRLENLRKFVHAGVPVFAPDDNQTWPIALQLATSNLRDIEFEDNTTEVLWLITDDNMATEYKNPQVRKPLRFDATRKWSELFNRIEF